MRLCLVSDSHRHRDELLRAVKGAQPVNAILHAGDEASDAVWLAERVNWPIIGVSGNWDTPAPSHPLECVVDDYGPRILLTHGHKLRVKEGLDSLAKRAEEVQASVVVYGHTHEALITLRDGRLYVNPGSLAMPRGRRERTFGILDIQPWVTDKALSTAQVRASLVSAHGITIVSSTVSAVLPVFLGDSGT